MRLMVPTSSVAEYPREGRAVADHTAQYRTPGVMEPSPLPSSLFFCEDLGLCLAWVVLVSLGVPPPSMKDPRHYNNTF